MTRLLLGSLILGFWSVTATGVQTRSADADLGAIRSVVQDYISADPAKLREAFLSTMNLNATDEKGGLRTIPFAEYLQRVSGNPDAGHQVVQASIDSIDHTGNAAIVKVTTIRPEATVTDYLSLLRIDEHWKIVNKTFSVERRISSEVGPRPDQGPVASPCTPEDRHVLDFMIASRARHRT